MTKVFTFRSFFFKRESLIVGSIILLLEELRNLDTIVR